ncbi:unnamed protein product [Peniophora sp. CBMAI 1063]|nr:unnamed protein product [Peniophora sp. CBMAI 1063]
MSLSRSGVQKHEVKRLPDSDSDSDEESTSVASRVKRQRVEVVLDINARRTTSLKRERSQSVECIAGPSLSRRRVDDGPPHGAPFDMKKWKENLRKLYSPDCALLDDDVRARLKDLLAKLPDKQTQKDAMDYVAVLGDVVRENAQAEYDGAQEQADGAMADLESVRAELARAKVRVSEVEKEFDLAKRGSDDRKDRLGRVKSVSRLIEDLVAGTASTHREDAEIANAPSDVTPKSVSDAKDDLPENPENVFAVRGFFDDIEKDYNGIYLGCNSRPQSTMLRDWKVWPLFMPNDKGEKDDRLNGVQRPSFITDIDVVEAPSHLACAKCNEGPRETRAKFPEKSTSQLVLQRRCLYRLKRAGNIEDIVCLTCRRFLSTAKLDRCGADQATVHAFILNALKQSAK